MLSIDHLKDCYGFKQAKWKVINKVLETDKGLKRLVNWTDEKNVRWHVLWRDQLAENTSCLTNRMIQTINGERILLTDAGWVTLHDVVTSLYSYKKREKEMGLFFGKYFTMDIPLEADVHDPSTNMESILTQPLSLNITKENKHVRFFEGIRKESLHRYKLSSTIIAKDTGKKVPVVAPIESLDEGKIVYGKLYWANSAKKPEKGYGSLRNVLTEWLQRYGQSSLFQLLDEIDKYYPMKDYHGQGLLAECIMPWEFIEFVEKAKAAKEEEEFLVWKERLSYRWEATRALVKALDEWLDVTRKKVKV